MQDPARAAHHTLPTGKTPAVFYRFAMPGIMTDVDIDGAIERTDAALHTTQRIRNNQTGRKNLTPRRFGMK